MIAWAYGGTAAAALLLAAAAAGHREREVVRRRVGASTEPRLRRAVPERQVRLAAAFAGASALGWHLAGPVGAAAAPAGVGLVLRASRERRSVEERDRFDEQLRDVAVGLAASTRAGLSLRRALREVTLEARPPLRPILERVVRRLEVGEPIADALAPLVQGSPDARLLTAVLEMHQRTGGDLPVMLEELAGTIGRRVEARHQARALTAQGRASGAVLAVLPIAFVGLLSGTSGSALGAFYRTTLGSLLLLSGLALEAVGYLWLRRIVRGSEARA